MMYTQYIGVLQAITKWCSAIMHFHKRLGNKHTLLKSTPSLIPSPIEVIPLNFALKFST